MQLVLPQRQLQGRPGEWHYGVGLGWKHYYLNADSYTDAVEANTVAHSACNPGGSCPGTHWTYTSYPP